MKIRKIPPMVRGRAGRESKARGAVGTRAGGHVRRAAQGGAEEGREAAGECDAHQPRARDGDALCTKRPLHHKFRLLQRRRG